MTYNGWKLELFCLLGTYICKVQGYTGGIWLYAIIKKMTFNIRATIWRMLELKSTAD